MHHARLTVLAVATTVSLALGGCAAASGPATTADPATSTFGHVHGIGLNPGDDRVYVASHHGVFRLDDGSPTLVAARAQDTMGFTITAPDHFLASGHPAIASTDPNPLGLIASTDRAITWSPVSLAGSADLHAIDTAGTTIYAYSSAGEILASDDGGQAWDTVARGQFIDIAADPRTPDRLLATTDTGTLVSITRGEEPIEVRGAPTMVLIDRTSQGRIVGVDPAGSVLVGSADGSAWQERTALGARPQALSVRADTWFAATDVGLVQSSDDGATWDRLLAGIPAQGS